MGAARGSMVVSLFAVVVLGAATSRDPAGAAVRYLPSAAESKEAAVPIGWDTGGIDRNYDPNYDTNGWDRRFDRNLDRNYDNGGWDRRFDRNFDRNYDKRGWDRPPNHFLNTHPQR